MISSGTVPDRHHQHRITLPPAKDQGRLIRLRAKSDEVMQVYQNLQLRLQLGPLAATSLQNSREGGEGGEGGEPCAHEQLLLLWPGASSSSSSSSSLLRWEQNVSSVRLEVRAAAPDPLEARLVLCSSSREEPPASRRGDANVGMLSLCEAADTSESSRKADIYSLM
ncbi:hypothetical protein EYF80_003517 [Liparis tanakae]|uniref:Uncharacterized protein n=1 Tax=Liparis tanakae TaxID=230148 RepID=A0A4Z2J7N9_9TELE|nr:hypothetical protein EYF80_003517 [Liparis tanakae]